MIKLLDLGFAKYVNGYEDRGYAIAADLSDQQIEALKELETYRREYFEDLRVFFRRKAEALLNDVPYQEKPAPDQIFFDLANGCADLALRMSDKFSLQMAEIIHFGERQGELPEMESTRLL